MHGQYYHCNSIPTSRHFNSLLLMSFSLALVSTLPLYNSILIGCLLASSSESDIKSNELKLSIRECVLKKQQIPYQN